MPSPSSPTGAGIHGLVRGRATRLLHDAGTWDAEAVSQRVGRALTPGTPAADGARFVEGFLAGSGTVLVHDADLLGIVDTWISTMTQRRVRRRRGPAAADVRGVRAGRAPPARRARHDDGAATTSPRSAATSIDDAGGRRDRHRAALMLGLGGEESMTH